MEILEKGTTVIILDRNEVNYSIGSVIEAYIPRNYTSHITKKDDFILPQIILYVVEDNEGKLHKGFYDINFMIPEDYKKYLLAQINENNEQIRELSEDNNRISNLIQQVEEEVDKHTIKQSCDDKTQGTQTKQRKFVLNTQNN